MPAQEASSLGLRVVSLTEFDMLEQQALHDPSLERDSSSFWEMRERLTAEVLRDFTLVRLNGPLLQQPGKVRTGLDGVCSKAWSHGVRWCVCRHQAQRHIAAL